MDLQFFQILWFLLIAILFTGFLFLEGFDYGVGILMPFVGKSDHERRLAINTIGPVWDGNEVWLLTAGGAMFAAFPHWYATLFSGFYLALFLILIALIVRGVAFEFRSLDKNLRWRSLWDGCIFVGSLLPALLWGVAFGNILRGVAIDANMHYVGTFWDLLNPYALLGGLVTLTLFTLHGALYLEIKADGPVRTRAQRIARTLVIPVILIIVAFLAYSMVETQFLQRMNAGQRHSADRCRGGIAVDGILHLPRPLWTRLCRHIGHNRQRDGIDLQHPLPPRDAFHAGVRPHNLQRLIHSLHPAGHEHPRVHAGAARPALSRLDVLGLPQAPHA